jgi:hypothetical protein
MALIDLARAQVGTRFEVTLELEIVWIGDGRAGRHAYPNAITSAHQTCQILDIVV